MLEMENASKLDMFFDMNKPSQEAISESCHFLIVLPILFPYPFALFFLKHAWHSHFSTENFECIHFKCILFICLLDFGVNDSTENIQRKEKSDEQLCSKPQAKKSRQFITELTTV